MVTLWGLPGWLGVGGAGSFTFLHAIVKRVEKSARLHFGRSNATWGGEGGEGSHTHSHKKYTTEKRSEPPPLWSVDDVSSALRIARVVHARDRRRTSDRKGNKNPISAFSLHCSSAAFGIAENTRSSREFEILT